MQYIEGFLNWFSNINDVILIMTYGGVGTVLLGFFIIRYFDDENNGLTETEGTETELTETEIEIKYLNERIVFLEELFSVLNGSYIDYIEKNQKKLDTQNKVLVSHGNVISKLSEKQTHLKDILEGRINQINMNRIEDEAIINKVKEMSKANRKYLHN